MKSLQVKVHIPKPCNENWEKMLPTEQGRFCLSCQKTVVDFTQKTNADILAFIAANSSACGRFNRDQVLLAHELPRTFLQRWKDYVAAASLVIGTKLMVLTPAVAQTTSVSQKSTFAQEPQQQEEPLFDADGNLHLKGKVLDVLSKRPLAGVWISLKQASQNYQSNAFSDPSVKYDDQRPFRTVTDSAGGFELIIPAVDLGSFSYNLQFEKQAKPVPQIIAPGPVLSVRPFIFGTYQVICLPESGDGILKEMLLF